MLESYFNQRCFQRLVLDHKPKTERERRLIFGFVVIDIYNNIHSMNIVSTVDRVNIYTLNNVQLSDYFMEKFFLLLWFLNVLISD